MFNIFRKNKKGVTLIELLLYLSLFIVIFGALFTSLQVFYSNKIKNRTIMEVEQQGQIVSLIISQEIRNVQSIISPGLGSSSSILSLEHLNPANSPLSFSLFDNKIIINEGGDINDLTASRLKAENLSFVNNSVVDGTQTIFFSFDLSYDSISSRNEYIYEKNFSGTVNLLIK